MAYNEKQLGLKKAKEISKYKAEIKSIKKDYNKKKRNLPKYKKKDLKNKFKLKFYLIFNFILFSKLI